MHVAMTRGITHGRSCASMFRNLVLVIDSCQPGVAYTAAFNSISSTCTASLPAQGESHDTENTRRLWRLPYSLADIADARLIFLSRIMEFLHVAMRACTSHVVAAGHSHGPGKEPLACKRRSQWRAVPETHEPCLPSTARRSCASQTASKHLDLP